MNNDIIRIGIVGAGNIAQNQHIPTFMKQQNVEVTAVCDADRERAEEVAQKFGIRHAMTDYRELTALHELDAVIICTGNNMHEPVAIAAAKAGKHILCEKPMAMNVSEAESMMNAAYENKVIFMMGFARRFLAECKVIKDLQEAGKFGEIYYGKAVFMRRRGTPLGWFTNMKKSGGGPVIDIGVHAIDLTWYFMGKPKPISVSAVTYSKIGNYETKGVSRWVGLDKDSEFNTEDSASGLIRFENGASMTFDVSWAINARDTGLCSQIFGTKAGGRINPLEIYGEEENHLMDSFPVVKEENAFENEIQHFVECIREGKQTVSPAEDGYQIQRILNGIYDSARLGREVLL